MMKDFGGAGLGLGFLDNIFGDFLKGSRVSFSFRDFSRPGGARVKAGPGQRINLDELFAQTRRPQRPRRRDVRYELSITQKEASQGAKKILTRRGKRLEVKIPPGVKTGSIVRLPNARRVTDGRPGDVLIEVRVK
jgi:curved DNA-binding protein